MLPRYYAASEAKTDFPADLTIFTFKKEHGPELGLRVTGGPDNESRHFACRQDMAWFARKHERIVKLLAKFTSEGGQEKQLAHQLLIDEIRLFSKNITSAIGDDKTTRFGAHLLAALQVDPKRPLNINFVGDADYLLWDMLILENGRDEFHLGESAIVFRSRTPIATGLSNEVHSNGKLNLYLGLNSTLNSSRDERHYLSSAAGLDVKVLPTVPTGDSAAKAKFLQALAKGPYSILHLCTHGRRGRDDFTLEVDEATHLNGIDLRFSPDARIFFCNNCHGANNTRSYGPSLGATLGDQTNSAAVVSVGHLRDAFAFEFCQKFYKKIIPVAAGSGESVGAAILSIRQSLVLSSSRLEALSYKIYGWPHFKVVQAANDSGWQAFWTRLTSGPA